MRRHAQAGRVPIAAAALLAAVSMAIADDVAQARFHGAGKADPIRITNVTCKPSAVKGEGTVTFDIAWDHSWRAAWEVAQEQHGGKETLKIENWDAAWVFVKFRQQDGEWSHATLSPNAADHTVPAGAALDVGLSDDPSAGGARAGRGLGVFIYRAAPGSGKINWNGVKLRWLHGADGVPKVDGILVATAREAAQLPAMKPALKEKIDLDAGSDDDGLGGLLDDAVTDVAAADDAAKKAGKIDIRICGIGMVYVPECAFWLGDGASDAVAGHFTAGDSTGPFRVVGESAITLGGASLENLGNSDGLFAHDDFSSRLTQPLLAVFPKGFAAFYCMKRELTLGMFADFCNTLNAGHLAGLSKELFDVNNIRMQGAGANAGYVTPRPEAVRDRMSFPDTMLYAAWAGLRPMTELEFEKVCRGPIRPVPDEYAWGADGDASDPRVAARASYWGILGLSGGAWEPALSVGHPLGRRFTGCHGAGAPAVPVDWTNLEPAGIYRGGSGSDPGKRLRVSDREKRIVPAWHKGVCGCRCVRSVAAGRAPVEPEDESPAASGWFNEALRLENLAVTPRDAKTATITFDIAWGDSWRNDRNYDAAWVFFKARAKGAGDWQHVRLVADKVLNPTGYSQEKGDKVEFVVPDGPEGFTGVFVQRAAPGSGPMSAKGITVVCDASSLNPEPRTLNHSLQAFGLEMVYVPEGAFCVGSGGTEENRFYCYTDGSQNVLPYRVSDAGTIPTGPQAGRLWATGVTPDGSDAGAIPAAFPNGYPAFYCMKYQIRKGQFAGFLVMQSDITSSEHAYRGGIGPVYTVLRAAGGAGLTWHQGAAFGAWAGLRPMTELEFEKACRGPDKPAPNDVVSSYWGIHGLNFGTGFERAVSVATPGARAFTGTHGTGTPALPADWPPATAVGVMCRGGAGGFVPISRRSRHIGGENPARQLVTLPDWTPEGWRGLRTAPVQAVDAPSARAGFRLELDPLPDLKAADIGIFHLAGRFHNPTDKPMKVELTTSLPDSCFEEGAAARAFSAAPKVDTPFRIQTVVTRQTARAARRVQLLPVRIAAPDGAVLAEQTARLTLIDPLTVGVPVIGSIEGGRIVLRITNTTDRAVALTVAMAPPPDIGIPEIGRNVEVAAGGNAEAVFAVPGQPFSDTGFRGVPYRVTTGKNAAQPGELVAELRAQSRWWVGRSEIDTGGPKLDAPDLSSGPGGGSDELDGMIGDLDLGSDDSAKAKDKVWESPPDLFKSAKHPARWKSVTHGAGLWLSRLNPLPKRNTLVLAATRVTAPAEREAVIRVGSESAGWTWLDGDLVASCDWGLGPGTRPFLGRVLLNGEVIYDSRPDAKECRRPVHIRKGVNNLLVQCQANADGAENLGNIFALFYDAGTGARITDLEFDVEKR